MDHIHIFDRFLEDADYQTLRQFVYDSMWKYGHRNGTRETLDTTYFSNMFMDNFITDYVRTKIERTIGKPLNMTRNYLQTQEFGENGGYHTDTDDPNTYSFEIARGNAYCFDRHLCQSRCIVSVELSTQRNGV